MESRFVSGFLEAEGDFLPLFIFGIISVGF